MLSICCQLGSSIVSKKLRGTICMVKMALWFYATLSSNFPLFWVAFVQKACSSFVFFREERLHMRSKLLVCIRGGVGNLLGFQKFIKKSLGEWVQTRGYQALRILHTDTPTRLFSESAHKTQIFF